MENAATINVDPLSAAVSLLQFPELAGLGAVHEQALARKEASSANNLRSTDSAGRPPTGGCTTRHRALILDEPFR